ncbi:MAG TPA: nucleotidyltransferase [Nitrospiraceae bacterium]|nr:nucleotidyltransferase [Nitrospiraceae bacterium]
MASTAENPSVTGSFLPSLVPAIRALANLLRVSQVPGAIIGGVAASLQGQARTTEDVDVLVRLDENALDRFLEMAKAEGFRPRIPDAIPFARRSAVLLLEHEASRVGVDLTISRMAFDSDAIDRARPVAIGDLRFSVVAPEDLIIMKAVAHRPQDLQDIHAVTRANPRLDVRRVRTHVQEFARALDKPEIWADIAPLLKSRVRRKPTMRKAKSRKKK